MGNALGFVVVVLAAVVVAAIVYRSSLRRGAATTEGHGDDTHPTAWVRSGAEASAGPGSEREAGLFSRAAYLPVVSSGSSWQRRVTSIVGLVVLVSFGAVALALTLYVVGSTIARVLTHAAHTGG